ncbi:ATP-binding protein [Patescibacteria group bacterium]|nr:ATP-binding protein [Patescibacteria group bacterium]
MYKIKETIIRQNKHWDENYQSKSYIKRDLLDRVNFDSKFIEIITGVRRSGKSTILNILIDNLIFIKKIEARKILFLNFDSPSFISIYKHPQELSKVVDEAETTTGTNIEYLFLDEIQNIEYWEKWIKEVYDLNKFKKIIITGSNSRLLEGEFISRLSGRYFSHINYPFSFKEYLRFKGQNFYDDEINNYQIKNKLIKNFNTYLYQGGFPEAVIDNNLSILENYYKTIILKDVIDNNQIEEKVTLKELAYYLITNYTSLFSYNKLADYLNKHDGIIKNYISFLQNAYIFTELKKFDFSLKKQNINNKKIYAVDNGLITQVGFNFSQDKGKLLENLVFLELQRRQQTVFYYSNNNECDFLVKDNKSINQAIQVVYDLNQKNRDRELAGIFEAMEKFDVKNGLIITYNHEETVTIDGKKISIIPAWKWILEK